MNQGMVAKTRLTVIAKARMLILAFMLLTSPGGVFVRFNKKTRLYGLKLLTSYDICYKLNLCFK